MTASIRHPRSDEQSAQTSAPAPVGGLIAAEGCLIAVLHGLAVHGPFPFGPSDLLARVNAGDWEDAVAAVILVGALVIAYWLFVSTAAHGVSAAWGRPIIAGAVGRVTPPLVRSLFGRVLALSVLASSAVGSPAARAADLAAVAHVFADPGDRSAAERADPESDVILPPHLRSMDESEAAARAPLDAGRSETVVVQIGDSLWSISTRHLQGALGRRVISDDVIARYWVEVIAANQTDLRSGNPDLIFPGEVITLPGICADCGDDPLAVRENSDYAQ